MCHFEDALTSSNGAVVKGRFRERAGRRRATRRTEEAAAAAHAVARAEAEAERGAALTCKRALEIRLAAAKARTAAVEERVAGAMEIVVVYNDDDKRRPEEIEGCNCGLWEFAGFDAERSVNTDVLACREASPSLPAPDDARASSGRTYDDIARSPPPHLRCVVSPLSSLSPILRRIAASPPRFFLSPTSRG